MIIKAVPPYIHPEYLNFKTAPYKAWIKCGGQIAEAHYPARLFHALAYRWELSTLWKSKKEVRLRFVEPVSLYFDTFPDYVRYEIIPMVWDCWPCYFEKMCRWLKKHKVRTAIFTSSQTAERISEILPEMNVMWCPEAVDTSMYDAGKPLKERTIDVLEFGRKSNYIANENEDENEKREFRYVCTKVDGKFIYTNEQLYDVMGDAKITIALPRNITQSEVAGDIETLTQRYWENMLSRIVMVGHAPKELIELIGYNPVIEIDKGNAKELIQDILAHIEEYQPLVDKNRETALRLGAWTHRMKEIIAFLRICDYQM